MSFRTLPVWRLRLTREAPRYLLYAVSVAGLAASARFAIAPPSARSQAPDHTPAHLDLGARAYAVLFARRYLTWNANRPDAYTESLADFAGSLETSVGFMPPIRGTQHVQWAEAVQSRTAAPGEQVLTVAAQTDTAGLLYLSVTVLRDAAGELELAGYPAFVGPPASAPAVSRPRLRDVTDSSLVTVVTRAMRNYLAGAGNDLAADLGEGARVSAPVLRLTLAAINAVQWEPDGRSLDISLQARDGRGAEYVLAYEVDVAVDRGRWEVTAVQSDPAA